MLDFKFFTPVEEELIDKTLNSIKQRELETGGDMLSDLDKELKSVCKDCPEHVLSHMQGLLEDIRIRVDSITIDVETSFEDLKDISVDTPFRLIEAKKELGELSKMLS